MARVAERYSKMTTEKRTRRGVWRSDDVFSAAYERIAEVMKRGDRVVVATSGGKDSTAMMEMAIIVARDHDMLPIDVVTRDEEMMYPGTYEYLHRVAHRTDEVDFHWVIAGQPIFNAYDRFNPYWWVFDDRYEDRWIRGYPGYGEPQTPRPAYWDEGSKHLWNLVSWDKFPLRGYRGWEDWDELTHKERLKKAKAACWPYDESVAQMVNLVGVRAQESHGRYMATLSMGQWMTGVAVSGHVSGYPLFDWNTPDVWKFIGEFGFDYNEAYDVMTRYGMKGDAQRIAPPTFAEGVSSLRMASNAWPKWWDKVCNRVGGMRRAAQFGKVAIEPRKNPGQTWQEVYMELCDPTKVPGWIAERAQFVVERVLKKHPQHSSAPFQEEVACPKCPDNNDCWKNLVKAQWDGDPFVKKSLMLKSMEPEHFREGAGVWYDRKEAYAAQEKG